MSRHDHDHDKADQARNGLIDSVKGKAKEVLGAFTGSDSLTTEGQLEQAQARERKEANSIEAVADAEAKQARATAAEARMDGAKERSEVASEAAAVEASVRAQQNSHEQAAEQAGAQHASRERAAADREAHGEMERAQAQRRVDVRASVDDIADAVNEHQTAEHITRNAHEEADRARARAERITNDADLP
ncbi:MAG: hypothetical protein JWP55_1863 [Mycobacterium sp.]|jgi:uncharacterized protein YjbJ (UPF0337 family)|nr:hypothetical protein [Mycobacterium sp.]